MKSKSWAKSLKAKARRLLSLTEEPSIDQDTVTSESRIVVALMTNATMEEYVPEDSLQVRLRRQDEQILALTKMAFQMNDKLNTIMEEAT
ncbi:hypothetical protein AAC387_Pa04g1065 [Persea americana]